MSTPRPLHNSINKAGIIVAYSLHIDRMIALLVDIEWFVDRGCNDGYVRSVNASQNLWKSELMLEPLLHPSLTYFLWEANEVTGTRTECI